MEGLTANKEYIKDIEILPKGPNSYYNVKFRNASFIDSCSFISAPLGELVDLRCRPLENEPDKVHEILPITSKYIKQYYGEEVLKKIHGKQVYPYTLAKNVEELKAIKEWPPKSHFFNILNDTNLNKNEVLADDVSDKYKTEISDKDYNHGQEIWDAIKKHKKTDITLYDIHAFYLMTDVCLLSDIWVWFHNTIKLDFGLDATNFVSGAGLCYRAALKMGETDLELLTNHSHYLTFEGMLRGGFVSVVKRHVKCNNIHLKEKYKKDQLDKFLIFLDFNSLYAEQLCRALPYANFEYVDKHSFKERDFILNLDTTDNSDKGWVITASIKIPNNLKKYYDDLPLGLIHTDKINPSDYTKSISTKGGERKLIAGHFDLEQYSFDAELLKKN